MYCNEDSCELLKFFVTDDERFDILVAEISIKHTNDRSDEYKRLISSTVMGLYDMDSWKFSEMLKFYIKELNLLILNLIPHGEVISWKWVWITWKIITNDDASIATICGAKSVVFSR